MWMPCTCFVKSLATIFRGPSDSPHRTVPGFCNDCAFAMSSGKIRSRSRLLLLLLLRPLTFRQQLRIFNQAYQDTEQIGLPACRRCSARVCSLVEFCCVVCHGALGDMSTRLTRSCCLIRFFRLCKSTCSREAVAVRFVGCGQVPRRLICCSCFGNAAWWTISRLLCE